MPRKANRGPQGAGTIRQRKDGRWEARITLGRNPATGKQIQKSIYGKSAAEVVQKMHALLVAVNEGNYQEPSKLTVAGWMDIWLADFTGNIKEDTAKLYEQITRTHIKPAFGAVKLQALQTITIQRLYNKLLHNGLSAKTISNIHGVLSGSLSQAVALGYIRTNPASLCSLPRVTQAEMKPLDMPDASAFLQALSGHRFKQLYSVAMLTGIRQGELLGLLWKNVNFERGTIHIDRQLKRPRRKGEVYRFGPPKNDKERTITPAPSVMEMLREQRHMQNQQRVKAGPVWHSGQFSGLVFTDEVGDPLKYHTVLDNYKAVLVRAGLEERRFHDLRHTFAVLSLISGVDPKSVQMTLGHSSVSFTLDRYAHFTETMRRQSAEKMETLYQMLETL